MYMNISVSMSRRRQRKSQVDTLEGAWVMTVTAFTIHSLSTFLAVGWQLEFAKPPFMAQCPNI